MKTRKNNRWVGDRTQILEKAGVAGIMCCSAQLIKVNPVGFPQGKGRGFSSFLDISY